MKRSLLFAGGVVLVIAILCALYRLSSLCKRTDTLEIVLRTESLAPDVVGYRAAITNKGYLPVLVTRCESVSDMFQKDVTVSDALEKWESQDSTWKQVIARNECRTVAHKMLWPGQALGTAPFFANVGVAQSPFHHGDRVRFLVYPRKDTEGIASPEFIVN